MADEQVSYCIDVELEDVEGFYEQYHSDDESDTRDIISDDMMEYTGHILAYNLPQYVIDATEKVQVCAVTNLNYVFLNSSDVFEYEPYITTQVTYTCDFVATVELVFKNRRAMDVFKLRYPNLNLKLLENNML